MSKKSEDYSQLLCQVIYDALYAGNNSIPDVNLVKEYLEKGADATAPFDYGLEITDDEITDDSFCRAAINFAAETDDFNVILTAILENGFDPLTKLRFGNTILHDIAGKDDCTENIRTIVSFNPDILKGRNAYGYLPIHYASTCFDPYENLELLISLGSDVNGKDYEGNTPLHKVIQYSTEESDSLYSNYTVLLEGGADITLHNKAGESAAALHLMGINLSDHIIDLVYNNSYKRKNWTPEEVATKLESSIYAEVCGLKENLNEKNPEHWQKKYNDLRTSYGPDGQPGERRSPLQMASHIKDFIGTRSKQLFLPALLLQYPELETLEPDQLEYSADLFLRAAFSETFFGAHHPTNTPQVALHKILELVNKYDRHAAHIHSQLLDPDLIKSADWYMPTETIRMDNGLYIVPLENAEKVKEEGDTLEHCVFRDHLSRFVSGKALPYGIRKEKDVPYLTAAIKPNKLFYEEYHKPQGISLGADDKNAADKTWDQFVHNLNAGKWGKPEELIKNAQEHLRIQPQHLHPLTTAVGFNPFNKDSYVKSEKAWDLLRENTDDLLRYRKLDLASVIWHGGAYKMFDIIAQNNDLEVRPFPIAPKRSL